MTQSQEAKLARVEAWMEANSDKLDLYHAQIIERIVGLEDKVGNHAISIAKMTRDWWWVFAICSLALSTAAYALVEFVKK